MKTLFYLYGKKVKGIRLLGITLTNLDPLAYENIVLPLWEKS